ncbi:MAG: YdiU family protein [Pseudomonadota bacterium]|nr:YdiU family protein [Pseudomonadota bacterium]
MHIQFDNSYTQLPDRMFARSVPARSPDPALIQVNRDLASELGLDPDWLTGPEGLEVLSGRRIAEGSDPIAQAYAGHQFGHFVPQLGDGRAILLGEVIDRAGQRRDIQLKGAGRTRFSRGGDGRAALGPVLREYVLSEAMAALGIRTTRALAALTTGEEVYREAVLPGALLVRVASSHIRVGTFQYFAAQGDVEGLRHLADHALARHYPEAARADEPILGLLAAVIGAQADLVASWLHVGFIHGVMNTDNSSVSGETIDYGPCAFLDEYDPAKVFSSIDRAGRYAYGNQPRIAQWNLSRLAEALLPLIAEDQETAIEKAQDVLAGFEPRFTEAYHAGLRRKLGLFAAEDGDIELSSTILGAMHEHQVDFTLFFRSLGRAAEGQDESARSLFADPSVFDQWAATWRLRLSREVMAPAERRAAMDKVNPAFIPRNHQVEAMIKAAVKDGSFAPFEQLLAVTSRPYDDQPGSDALAQPPLAHERVTATFCGT